MERNALTNAASGEGDAGAPLDAKQLRKIAETGNQSYFILFVYYSMLVTTHASVVVCVCVCVCLCSVAKPFPPICVLLNLCFPYFSLVLRILTPIFSTTNKPIRKSSLPNTKWVH